MFGTKKLIESNNVFGTKKVFGTKRDGRAKRDERTKKRTNVENIGEKTWEQKNIGRKKKQMRILLSKIENSKKNNINKKPTEKFISAKRLINLERRYSILTGI